MTNAAVEAAGPRTEKFLVPMGRYLGYVVVGAAVLLVVLAITGEGTGSRGLVGFAVSFGVVGWIVLIRPEVTAHRQGLLMRNMLRDIFVPWVAVKGCRVAQTLQISTRDKVYHGLGISKSARAANQERRQMRRQAVGPTTGMSPLQFMTSRTSANRPGVHLAQQEHVIDNNFAHAEQRIETLAVERAAATVDQTPMVVWDWGAIAALVLAVLAAAQGFVS